MSEISALAHEYRAASQLSETLNRALIGLKKARRGTPDETVDPEELRRARAAVATILEWIATALRAEAGEGLRGISEIPPAVTTHILERHRGDLPYYVDDLDKLQKRLSGVEALSDGDLKLLDEIVALIDKETAQVFRRLMRK
jgi:hypothetical protein